MKKRNYLLFFLVVSSFFLSATSSSYAEEAKNNSNLDVSNGWTINFNTNFPNIETDQIFVQNHENKELKQKMIINNFANIGDASLTATKAIPMKKGYKYTIHLVYAMQFKEAKRGWIDFNGERVYSELEAYPYDKEYKATIIPDEDFVYMITIHYDVKKRENGYLKLGYSLNNKGIEEIPQQKDSSVVIKYFSENGQQLLKNERIRGKIGEPYSIQQKDIEGYSVKEIHGQVSGHFTSEQQEVMFVYSKNNESRGRITAYYQDEAGKQLEEPVIKEGTVGEKYKITEKAIDGYRLKHVQGEQEGIFKMDNQSIVYTYEKLQQRLPNSVLTIYYQDENGKELAESTFKKGVVGQNYEVDIKDIPNYFLKEVMDEHFGEYAEQNQIVKCVYVKSEVMNIVNQTSVGGAKKIPLLGETSKRILQIAGLLILVIVLIFIVLKRKKKLQNK